MQFRILTSQKNLQIFNDFTSHRTCRFVMGNMTMYGLQSVCYALIYEDKLGEFIGVCGYIIDRKIEGEMARVEVPCFQSTSAL